MILYFEFEEKRRKAEVTWPRNDENIIVHITDPDIAKDLPTDLFFEIEKGYNVTYTIENPDNKRLLDLQTVIRRRLQESVQ
ncbi:MAG: hypothetical protein JWQ40_275 [Segetibacter sp.]|nr:hypothetical protein [Segetibacter sp.]